MERLTPDFIQAEWRKEAALLYPKPETSSVAQWSIGAAEAKLAADPEGCLSGIRRLQQHFPDFVRLIGCEWCFDAQAYSNAYEVEFQARLLSMAVAQFMVSQKLRDPRFSQALPEPPDVARFQDDMAKRFGNLVVRVPGSLRSDLMSPRVLRDGRISFLALPVWYDRACAEFAGHLRDAARAQPGYGEDPLGSLVTAVTTAPRDSSTFLPAELVVSTVAYLAGNVDRVSVDDFASAVQSFQRLQSESDEADGLVYLLVDTVLDFAIAHEAGHCWAQDEYREDPAHAAAQEATAHVSALWLLVAYHHFFRDTGLFEAMERAQLSPVAAPLLIQVLHVLLMRYLFKLTSTIIQCLASATGDARLATRLKRVTDAHGKDLLHFQLMLEQVRDIVYADARYWTGDMLDTVNTDVARILDFQRAVFQRFEDRGAVIGSMTDDQLLGMYRTLQSVIPRGGFGG